ncbi:MAG: hypothetical protein WBA34_02475 [Candidatus Deferrimicrobiaceae bacterium]
MPSEIENELTAESQQGQTTGSGPSNPVATAIPSQDAGNADSAAGPETIDLTNAALYIIPDSPAFRFESTIKYAGVDMTGAAKEVSEIGSTEVQNLPQVTQRFVWALEGYVDPPGSSGSVNILTSDTVIIGDQMTSAQMVSVNGAEPKLFCNSGLASETQGPSLFDSIPRIQEWLTGQATRVESGIEVNGFVSDKYELSGDTLQGYGLVSAYVYVARDGGFITRYEMHFQGNEGRFGFDSSQLTDTSLTYNYYLVEDGSLEIAIPAECSQ